MREWKDKKDQYVAILRDLFSKANEGRENFQNSALGANGDDADQKDRSGEDLDELRDELTRI